MFSEGGTRKRLVWLALYVGFWTMLGLFDASRSYFMHQAVGRPFQLWFALVYGLADWYLWAALAPVVMQLTRQHPMGTRRWPYNLLVHLLVCLLLSCLVIALLAALNYVLVPFRDIATPALAHSLPEWFQVIFVESLVFYLWVYFAILGACHALDYYRRYREGELHAVQLEARLAQTQLQMLKMQLHPHFLFNTLNAISALMHRDLDLADRMLARLGDLLRMALKNAGAQEVPFRKEQEFIRAYLEIEQARLGPRLKVSMQCEPETLDASVPNLVWQPVVENAIRHGIAPRPEGGRLWMRAQRQGNRLYLEVSDDGPGLPHGPQAAFRAGIGLSNTRARLDQLYGSEHRFELKERPGGGLCVTLLIPFRVAPVADLDASQYLDDASAAADADGPVTAATPVLAQKA
jgi:two-component system LytT family sensor kinase